MLIEQTFSLLILSSQPLLLSYTINNLPSDYIVPINSEMWLHQFSKLPKP